MQIMNRPKEAIVVESFISGVKKPFLAHREVKVIGDDSWETYEEISGVKCPSPWHYCCIDRKRIARTTISIIDHYGTLLTGTREGVGGIEAGKRLMAQGVPSNDSTSQSVSLSNQKIQVLN